MARLIACVAVVMVRVMAMPRSYAGPERLDWFRRDGEGRGAPGQLHHFAERRNTRASGRSDGD